MKFDFVANLPVSLPVKEFWKSVNILGSYGQEFGVLFFSETQCMFACSTNKALQTKGRQILPPPRAAKGPATPLLIAFVQRI